MPTRTIRAAINLLLCVAATATVCVLAWASAAPLEIV